MFKNTIFDNRIADAKPASGLTPCKNTGALNFASKQMCRPASTITGDEVRQAKKDMANPRRNPMTGMVRG